MFQSLRRGIARLRPVLALLLPLALATSASAISISTSASVTTSTGTATDPQGPASSGSLASTVIDLFGEFGADASFDVNGNGALSAGGEGASGGTFQATATASWSETITNNTGSAQSYVLQMDLSAIQLSISGQTGNPFTAIYQISLLQDGGTLFASGATLTGDPTGQTLTETGTDLGGVFFQDDPIFPYQVGYDFVGGTFLVSLGTLAPGTSTSLAYQMTVQTSGDNNESGALASIGDPFGASGVSLSVLVPEPSAAVLLALCLVAVRVRRL